MLISIFQINVQEIKEQKKKTIPICLVFSYIDILHDTESENVHTNSFELMKNSGFFYLKSKTKFAAFKKKERKEKLES